MLRKLVQQWDVVKLRIGLDIKFTKYPTRQYGQRAASGFAVTDYFDSSGESHR